MPAAAPYVVPFGVFLLLLALQNYIPLPQTVEFALRIAILAGVIWYFSRSVLDLRVTNPVGTVAVGLGVFLLWIAPDVLFPGYRHLWLFDNPIVGSVHSSMKSVDSPIALALRSARAILIVPIVEELFWRGWLLRWLIDADFEKVPLGRYAMRSFWIVAFLFASEHGPYWDVGLMAGIVYNLWMYRTKRLGDLIWAHAITNAALCGYVIYTGKWEYWL